MNDQLAGSWDQPSATIVLHSAKPSKAFLRLSQLPVCSCGAYLCRHQQHVLHKREASSLLCECPSFHSPTCSTDKFSCACSQVQAAAASLADRAAVLLDVNERALALRTGGLRDLDDEREGRGGRDNAFGDSFQRRCGS